MMTVLRQANSGKVFCVLMFMAFAAGCHTADTDATKQGGLLTLQDCRDKGGVVVGDIGDGRIHKTDYKCPGGASPVGAINFDGESKIMTEGAVCCLE